ncbi:MAG: vitamin K epoxide reductase family protein [bacterium]|nr:vitamin K epoxide reductase family protein [bacterium]
MEFIKKIFRKKETIPLWWIIAIIFFVFAGLIDTAYLSTKQLAGSSIVCSIYEVNSCENVLTSEYSRLLGLPLSVWGFGYYMTIFVLALIYSASADRKFFKILFGLSIFGFLFSLRLVYLQFFVIENLCFYCMLSALFSTLIFITNSIYYLFSFERK